MPLHRANALTALIFVMLAAVPASAAVVYDELVDGDFSDNRSAPTFLTLLPGENDVFGVTGRPADGQTDLDYFSLMVPAGQILKSLIVLDSFLTDGGGAFMGLQRGDQITVDPNAPDAAPLLGYAILSPADIGNDILPRMSTAAGASGFSTPLGSGRYSVWIQDTNLSPSRYGLRVDVAPVPLPASAPLVLAGLVAFAWVGRRR